MSQANEVDSFLIFISRKDVDNVQQPQLCLELPYYPETLSDFLYTRFWLFQLSQCYFDSINFSCAVFNPAIVQLLFCHFTEGADLLGPVKMGTSHFNSIPCRQCLVKYWKFYQ
ncbi:unnamed protein product [Meloidogyne enterolobii]|uniref:Uncharacterized protein n=1 Tax=Meloidogyne enterolobii TaxID=390850 RepID=A0ACB0YUL0_MELEN